jgi:hypothetical protein
MVTRTLAGNSSDEATIPQGNNQDEAMRHHAALRDGQHQLGEPRAHRGGLGAALATINVFPNDFPPVSLGDHLELA